MQLFHQRNSALQYQRSALHTWVPFRRRLVVAIEEVEEALRARVWVVAASPTMPLPPWPTMTPTHPVLLPSTRPYPCQLVPRARVFRQG